MDNKKDEPGKQIPEQEWLTKEGHMLHRAEWKAGRKPPRLMLLVIALGLLLIGAGLLFLLVNQP